MEYLSYIDAHHKLTTKLTNVELSKRVTRPDPT